MQCVPEFNKDGFTCLLGLSKVSELIDIGWLKPFPLCTTAVQKVILTVGLEVDVPYYEFAAGSEIVVLNQGSLMVNAGSTLVLSGTHLHGCAALYQGIFVWGSLATRDNTIIEDAKWAIFQLPGATLNCTATTFDGNYLSIYATGQVGYANIAGCTFSGAKTLLSPVTDDPVFGSPPTQKPIEGIRLQSVPFYKIGSANSGLNVFKDFQRDNLLGTSISGLPTQVSGIHAIDSRVEVGYSQFENILASPLNAENWGYAMGIFSESSNPNGNSGPNHSLTVTGNGIAPNSEPVFRNCSTAIFTFGGIATNITNCYSKSCNYGFYLYPQGQNTQNQYISGNLFKDNHNRAIVFQPGELKNNQAINITHNIICFEETVSSAQNEHFGITCTSGFGGVPLQAGTFKISDNVISENGSSSVPIDFWGIWVIGVSHLEIKHNIITDFNSSSPSTSNKSFVGIRIQNADYSTVMDNSITGNSLQYAGSLFPITKSGIFIQNSKETTVQCNSVDKINNGISFQGGLCDPTDLKFNTFNAHNFGLNLDLARIGGQDYKDNIWNGSTGQIEAINKIPGWPSTPALQQVLNSSLFDIGSSNDLPASSRWANPRLIQGSTGSGGMDSDDADLSWFRFGIPTTPVLCSQSPTNVNIRLTVTNHDVIDGLLEPIYGHEATVWDAQFHTYDRLLRTPELRPPNSTTKTWYDANENSSFAQLAIAYEAVQALAGNTDPALETAEANLNSILDNLRQKQLDWAIATSATEKHQIEQAIATIGTSALAAKAAFEVQYAAFKVSENADRLVLITNLASLNLTTAHEQDFRNAISIPLEAAIAGNGLTANQTATLTAIANKCRLAGGIGVDIARQAIHIEQPKLAVDLACEAAPRNASSTENADLPMFYPNPVSEAFTLHWADKIQSGQIRLFDLMGNNLMTWSTADTDQFSSGPLLLPTGTYFLKIAVADQKPTALRFVLYK